MSEAAGLIEVYRHSPCATDRTRSIVSARRQRSHRSAAETPVQPIPGDIDSDEMFHAPSLRMRLAPRPRRRFGLQEPVEGATGLSTKGAIGSPYATAAPTLPRHCDVRGARLE